MGVAVTGVEPVLAPTPFGQQLAAVAPGNAFLSTLSGLYCRQHLEVLELVTGCEGKNRYSFTPIDAGVVIPTPATSSWSREYREKAKFNPFLKAKEESECFERICCPLFRGFEMTFKDGNGSDFLTVTRPFKCDPCYAPPCCTCNTQELSIAAGGPGNPAVATAKEVTGMCCTKGCFERQFDAMDPSGNVLYTLKVNDCSSASGGCNCCAPSLFNESLTVDIYGPDGSLLSPSTFVWPGCNCGGLTDLSNMVIAFPEGATADQRSALVAGMLLIEYTVMETRRQNNKNNNGGGGGGAPQSVEMKR